MAAVFFFFGIFGIFGIYLLSRGIIAATTL